MIPPTTTRTLLPVAMLAAAALTLTACGSDAGSDSPDRRSTGSAATDDTSFKTGGAATSMSGKKIDLAALDVCSLLTPSDATSVAKAQKLSSSPTATYSLKAVPQDPAQLGGRRNCTFRFSSDGSFSGSIQFIAESAKAFTVLGTAKRITGLGDEAYIENGGVPVVRVGNVMISTGEDSFDTDFATALMRRVIANVA